MGFGKSVVLSEENIEEVFAELSGSAAPWHYFAMSKGVIFFWGGHLDDVAVLALVGEEICMAGEDRSGFPLYRFPCPKKREEAAKLAT